MLFLQIDCPAYRKQFVELEVNILYLSLYAGGLLTPTTRLCLNLINTAATASSSECHRSLL